MPLISLFRGISVYIYSEPDAPHRLPHFHAYYGEHAATFTITPPGQLEGMLPVRNCVSYWRGPSCINVKLVRAGH